MKALVEEQNMGDNLIYALISSHTEQKSHNDRIFLLPTSTNKKSVTCAPKTLILWNGIKAVRADKGHFMVPFLCHMIYALLSSHQFKYKQLLHFMFVFLLSVHPSAAAMSSQEAIGTCFSTYNIENIVRPANESQDCFTSKLSKLFCIQY